MRSAGWQRAQWGVVDQGISSFTNFSVTAIVARQVAPGAFGAFSVALAVYICVLWVARSMVGEPFVVRMTGASETDQSDAAGDAVGSAVLIGVVTGLGGALVGLLVGGTTGAALTAMSLFLPALLAQDAVRYVLMARGRARSAAANDGAWFVVQTIVVVALLLLGRANVSALTAAFGSGAAVGAVFGAWQTGAIPRLGGARLWLRRHGDLWQPFLLELLTVSATPQLSMLAVAALGEVTAVGAVRAGWFLFAPLSVLFSGLYLVALPEAVRLKARSLHGLKVFVVALAAGMSLLTVAWAGGVTLVPSHLGRTLLGTNWASGRRLLWPVAAFIAASATVVSATVGLRALGVARQTMRARVWIGPVVFVSGVVGTELGGASGMAIGLAVSSWLSAGLAWLILLRALATAKPSSVLGQERPDSVGLLLEVGEWA